MSNKQRRSSSMSTYKKNDFDDYNEENSYEKNPYYNNSPIKNNYQYGITNYNNCFNKNIFDKVEKGELNVGFTNTKIQHPDGRVEFQSRIDIFKNRPRTITKTFNQTRVEKIRDFKIETQTKSFKTGLIFKDTHYYDTQKVIPKDTYNKYQRTVTKYSDGTTNYGDWRLIDIISDK